jgi:hypothetical protein
VVTRSVPRNAILPRPRLGWIAAAAVATLSLGAMLWVSLQQPAGYRFHAGDDHPPTDRRYQADIQLGRSHTGRTPGQLAAARTDLERLAAEHPRTSAAAWSLYQAGLAAQFLKDEAGRRQDWALLQRDYAEHPAAIRTREATTPAPSAKETGSDCGPRALAHLLEAAGKPTDLKQLTHECATDAHGTTLEALQRVAEKHGLRTEAAQVDAEFLKKERPQGIAWVEGVHYLCFQPQADRAEVWDPNGETTQGVTWEQLAQRSQGVVLLVAWGNGKLPKL